MESLLNRTGLLQQLDDPNDNEGATLMPDQTATASPGSITNDSGSTNGSNARPVRGWETPNKDSAGPTLAHFQTSGACRMHPAFQQIDERLNGFKAVNDPMSLEAVLMSPVLPGELEKQLLYDSVGEIFHEFPLFHLPWLIDKLEKADSLDKDGYPPWWALLNTLVATAIVSKSINSSFKETYAIAWGFFKNAYAIFPDLLLRGNQLLTVQSFLSMAMFMMSSADTRLAVFLLSAAVRELQFIALNNRRHKRSSASSIAVETDIRVFWVAYILDMEVSSNCGLPPLQSPEELDTDLPSDTPISLHCGIYDLEEPPNTKAFRLRAELATIQASIRRELYAVKQRHQFTEQVLKAVRDLDTALEHWQSAASIGVEFRNDAQSGDIPLNQPLISLHLAYHHCVSLVHWAGLQSESEQAMPDASSPDATLSAPIQITTSATKVRLAARSMIALIGRCSSLPFTDLW